ncbi:Cupin superfamily protein [Actinobacillus delphinicola]|uniref:Cupin superfamily protein n=2 Tax=Actinobacillus delphinicola TaxID=51161 RepID=A0A448TUL4_9PAST|nr:cupin domain-containing protein [Actinobacillus delphinicola]VEJ09689.1 Cupin superfamily protein [Actinobacillus delphinicola]
MKTILPASITPEIFLRDYWQKKPLLIRQGLPQIIGQFEPADIIELAQNEDATARLVKQFSDDDWRLSRSPLHEKDFKNLPEKWSVLVQNMEQWSLELGNLWQAFDFIPQWARDDIMVSYAPKGGSVGKHYDEYDVFLVQGYGERHWQLGKWCDPTTEFKPNQPIRIFDDMGELVIDETMQPGDVLYIPSRMAHYGVAKSDCLTFSFGLRLTNPAALLDANAQMLNHDNGDNRSVLQIPVRFTPPAQPCGELTPETLSELKRQFLQTLSESAAFDDIFQQAVAKELSSRRYDLLPTEEMADIEEIETQLMHTNARLRQDNNAKIIYCENPLRIYANGEWLDELTTEEAQLLKRLANGESFNYKELLNLWHNPTDKEAIWLILDSICNWLDDGLIYIED